MNNGSFQAVAVKYLTRVWSRGGGRDVGSSDAR